MKKQLVAMFAVAAVVAMSGTAFGSTSMVLDYAGQMGDGNWEYVYSVEAVSASWVVNCRLEGYDFSKLLNQCDPEHGWGGHAGSINQKWNATAANNPPSWTRDTYGSYSIDGANWIMDGVNPDHAYMNNWRDPSEYVGLGFTGESWEYAGNIVDPDPEDGEGMLMFDAKSTGSGTGVLLTFRIVTPDSPGQINYVVWSYIGEHQKLDTIVGPVGAPPRDGDFDGDGDVDADDVDTLCANMGSLDLATYDMDGDGVVDEDDMTFHVENYLDYDSDGDGVADGMGTFRGDFNTDGSVNGTDLSVMNGSFGGAAGFAGGNANCDLTVNGTDLSILAGVFGNVATAAVPEPMTIALLSLGGAALLRRRK